MATIVKEGKYWKLMWRIDGKQFKRSTRTTSKKIAEKMRIELENELVAKQFNLEKWSPLEQMKLYDFIKEAIEFSETNKSPSTVKREKRIFKNFQSFFGNISLSSINNQKIERYKNYLINDMNFTPNGVNIELRHLSAAFSVAVKYGYITKNPFKGVKKVKTPKKHPKYLTKKQASKLLEVTNSTSSYEYILIALTTGARVEEIVNLDWKDIDLKNKILKVNGKGAKDRTIPIPKTLIDYLKPREREEGVVCTGSARPDQVSKNFRKYADMVGLNDFTFHNLRDTYASWLVQKGTNLKVVKELLGHEDIKTTLLYAHLAPDNRFEAVKIVDDVLGED